MTINNTTIKNFDRTNGLGTISFSSELISSIIKNIFVPYPHYTYVTHNIKPVIENYYEVSICAMTPTRDLYMKEIERLQKDLSIILKQSLSLNCVVFLNITYGK